MSLPQANPIFTFLNRLDMPVPRVIQITRVEPHGAVPLPGWQGLGSILGIGERGEAYAVDVRYAWGPEIWKQHCVDFGVNVPTWLPGESAPKPIKMVVYLCEPTTGLKESQRFAIVPQAILAGSNWQAVYHIYLLLPFTHPFTLPEITKVPLSGFATTRHLQDGEPEHLPPNPARYGEGGLRTRGQRKYAQEHQPLISVITAVFNGMPFIEQAIQSVINQAYANIEFIVVDGGSRDGTLDVLREYDAQIDYWVSEPDHGIYAAMNKGLKLANGYIYHLGADDVLMPDALTQVAALLDPSQIVITNVLSGKRIVRSRFNWEMCFQNKVHHQSAFYPPAIKTWAYAEQYKICADYDLNLRLYNAGYRAHYLDVVTAYCRKTGISNAAYFEAHREISAIRRRLCPRAHLVCEPFFVFKYQTKYWLRLRMD